MSNAWFRVHNDVLDDPKLMFLPRADVGHFFLLLALKNSGALDQNIPAERMDEYVALRLRIPPRRAVALKARLMDACLVDEEWQPLAWKKRQYLNHDDGLTPEDVRRKKDRERKAEKRKKPGDDDVSATCPQDVRRTSADVHASDTDTDTDTDTEKATATSIPSSDNSMNPELLQDSDCLRSNCAKNAQSAQPKTDSAEIDLPEKNQTKLKPKAKPKPVQKPEPTRAVNPIFLKPEDVTHQAWCDFLTLRKAKKAPVSETAITKIRKQAELAGVPMQTAIETCCAHGWQGFNAEWYANLNRSNAKRRNDPEDIYEHNRKVGEAWQAEQQRNQAPLITGHSVIYDPLADAARRRAQAPLALTNGFHHA